MLLQTFQSMQKYIKVFCLFVCLFFQNTSNSWLEHSQEMNGHYTDTTASTRLTPPVSVRSVLTTLLWVFLLPKTNKQKCCLTPAKIISLMLPDPFPISTGFWELGPLNWTCEWCNIHTPWEKMTISLLLWSLQYIYAIILLYCLSNAILHSANLITIHKAFSLRNTC